MARTVRLSQDSRAQLCPGPETRLYGAFSGETGKRLQKSGRCEIDAPTEGQRQTKPEAAFQDLAKSKQRQGRSSSSDELRRPAQARLQALRALGCYQRDSGRQLHS